MNMKRKPILLVVGFVILLGFGLQAQQPAAPGRQMDYESKLDTVRSYADYFTLATAKKMTPDAEGFIRRWTLLEPISKPNRSNTVFTDSYLRKFRHTLFCQPIYRASQKWRQGKSGRTGVNVARFGQQTF